MNLIFTKLSLALFCAFPLPNNEAQPANSLAPTPNSAAMTVVATTNTQQTPSGSELLPFVPGRFVTYALFDGESHNTGKMLFRYDKDIVGNYKMEKYDASGHLRRTADGKLDCIGSTTGGDWTPKLLDVFFAYKNKNISLQSNDLQYPSTMMVGNALPDGHAHLVVSDNWHQNIDIEISATQRLVESQEMVVAGGNSYLCYRISYLQTTRTRTNGQNSVPVELRQTEWVAPTIGVVKTTTVSVFSGKTVSSSVISQIGNELPPAPVVLEPTPPANIIGIPNEMPSIPSISVEPNEQPH